MNARKIAARILWACSHDNSLSIRDSYDTVIKEMFPKGISKDKEYDINEELMNLLHEQSFDMFRRN